MEKHALWIGCLILFVVFLVVQGQISRVSTLEDQNWSLKDSLQEKEEKIEKLESIIYYCNLNISEAQDYVGGNYTSINKALENLNCSY